MEAAMQVQNAVVVLDDCPTTMVYEDGDYGFRMEFRRSGAELGVNVEVRGPINRQAPNMAYCLSTKSGLHRGLLGSILALMTNAGVPVSVAKCLADPAEKEYQSRINQVFA